MKKCLQHINLLQNITIICYKNTNYKKAICQKEYKLYDPNFVLKNAKIHREETDSRSHWKLIECQ